MEPSRPPSRAENQPGCVAIGAAPHAGAGDGVAVEARLWGGDDMGIEVRAGHRDRPVPALARLPNAWATGQESWPSYDCCGGISSGSTGVSVPASSREVRTIGHAGLLTGARHWERDTYDPWSRDRLRTGHAPGGEYEVVTTAMRPFMILMIWHTWGTERSADGWHREDQECWERTRQPDGREGRGRRMRTGVDGAVLVQVM